MEGAGGTKRSFIQEYVEQNEKKPPCSKRNCYKNVITIIEADPGAWRQAIVMRVEFRWSILRHVRIALHNSTCRARDRRRLDHGY